MKTAKQFYKESKIFDNQLNLDNADRFDLEIATFSFEDMEEFAERYAESLGNPKHKFNIGQRVWIENDNVLESRDIKEIEISIDSEGTKVIYIFSWNLHKNESDCFETLEQLEQALKVKEERLIYKNDTPVFGTLATRK